MGGQSWGSSHESKSRVIWKESQRAVRDEENEGKGNGRRWIKKRRERGQGISTQFTDESEKNFEACQKHNFNIAIK